jgi:hypothetical protein
MYKFPPVRGVFSFSFCGVPLTRLASVFCSPYAAHMHPPLEARVGPEPSATVLPGALPADFPGAFEGMSVERMNELDMAKKQSVRDRLEAESRGHESIFSQ